MLYLHQVFKTQLRKIKHKHIIYMPPRKVVKGQGITDYVNSTLNKRPKPISQYLQKYGDEKINRIIVSRKPVQGAIQKVANFLTNGEWNQNKQKLGFDDVYHLFLLVEVANKVLKLEKNERAMFKTTDLTLGDTMKYIDNIDYTLNEMFDRAEKLVGLENLYRYSAFENNCQVFLITLLKAIDKDTPELEAYIFQNVNDLVSSDLIKMSSNLITDSAGMLDYMINGGKKTKTKKKRKYVKRIL